MTRGADWTGGALESMFSAIDKISSKLLSLNFEVPGSTFVGSFFSSSIQDRLPH